jgi:hypothetical protein
MKKALFTLFILLSAFTAFSQSMPDIDSVKLTTKQDYHAAEPLALQVSTFILSTPSDAKSVPRLNGTKFLLDWMSGTPDYTLDLDKNVVKYFEKDLDLMGVYLASLTSSAIQNKLIADPKILTSIAVKKFIAYINNSSNNVNITNKLKKLIEADQKGQI